MGRLVIVSNRVPAAMRSDEAGGLAVALKGALVGGGMWFGWSGETSGQREAGTVRSRIEGHVLFNVIDLTEQDLEEYYHGYSNRALWPLMHYRVDLAEFRAPDFSGYMRVNALFAQALSQHIRADDTIWVQDYHLIPLARELRQHGLRNKIGFFLHIPWPSADIWSILPEHRELLEAFEAYDLVGFQTDFDTENFLNCLARAGLDATGGLAERVAAFPISIETEEFGRIASAAAAHPIAHRLESSLHGRKLMIGVDRLDYTKGISQRIAAFGRFLEKTPSARRQVVYLQVTPKSRSEVPEYTQIQRQVAEIAGRINGAYSELDWMPIRYLNRTIRREALAGLYRMADVGLVTPLRDGMNLVAKEYVSAQNPDDPGVLVLSQFAGAARELDGALLVNPYDQEGTADAIAEAAAMPLHERYSRWRSMYEQISRNDVQRWRESFLRALEPDRPFLRAAS